MTEMLELSEKDVKAAITTVLQRAPMNMLETDDKIDSVKIRKVSPNKENVFKKNKIKSSELKKYMTSRFNSRIKGTDERINKLGGKNNRKYPI